MSTQSFERYQPKFKHLEKLDSKKLPHSIKTTRSNALPNTQVITFFLIMILLILYIDISILTINNYLSF